MTRVVHRYKVDMKDSDVVYIGRGSVWGNPFVMQNKSNAERERVIESYRYWLFDQIVAGKITDEMLLELDGKRLACYCSPKPCHGDVLVRAVDWVKNRKMQPK